MPGPAERILVTGASGFVGRALCARLAGTGLHCRAAVRTPGGGPIEGAAETVAIGELGAHTDWSAALAGASAVVHLASHVHVPRGSPLAGLDTFRRVNVSGTEALARGCIAHGVRRIVYVSSIKVNGEATLERAFTERDPPRPEDFYGSSKWEAEQALAAIARETGLEVTVLRPPLVYGPGVKANFLGLMRAIDRGLPLPLGAIDNRRSLLYLGNLVDAIALSLAHPSAAGRTYVLSDGGDLSTPALVRMIASALGRRPRLLTLPIGLLRAACTVAGARGAFDRLAGSLQVDSSLVRAELGWRPPWTVAEGLAHTAAWWRGLSPPAGADKMRA